jgi:P4 family phage/plasmid primase-like protien
MESLMNSIDESQIQNIKKYTGLKDFLDKHATRNDSSKPCTNTRIPGDKDSGIYGGSYCIPDEEQPVFLRIYYSEVLEKKTSAKKEYLTEKQRVDDGPILIDIDFRYPVAMDDRQYTTEHIEDLTDAYLSELQTIFQMDADTKFPIYVLEKPKPKKYDKENIVKDGFHIIIGLQADLTVQHILRSRIVTQIGIMFDGFPTDNSWENVVDDSFSKAGGKGGNWQLYGSRKPNCDKYSLTHVYECGYDPGDNEMTRHEIPISKFDIRANFPKLSIRYNKHPSLFMKPAFIAEYNQLHSQVTNNKGSNAVVAPASASVARQIQLDNIMNAGVAIANIRNSHELDLIVNNFLDNVPITDYELKDAYSYTMLLPISYYGPGSYDKWIRVGWVLKNMNQNERDKMYDWNDKLLLIWIAFSAKSPTFQYSSIRELCDQWSKFEIRKCDGLTKLSLMHWAKKESLEDFNRIKMNTVDYFVENTIDNMMTASKRDDESSPGCGDFDLARVLYQMYKNEYVCVSVTNNIWYQYRNHRWEEIDSGTTLRKSISVQVRELYHQKSITTLMQNNNRAVENVTEQALMAQAAQLQAAQHDDGMGKLDKIKNARAGRILNIMLRMSKTNDKKNIMTEAKELFFDGTFLEKLDTNQYLLCFNNGVIDFRSKIFRPGQPEDNISMTTNIDYIELNPVKHKPIMDEINDFMDKLFPERELCEYMWDHLASTLIGTSTNQTFNMYIGVGSNGKSMLVNLMEKVLGQYKGDVPLSIITDKRGKVGGLTPEIVQLKGVRYAVMQEPDKGEKINVGVMKQLTSGKDQLQGRAPYMRKVISFLPQFKLVLACNYFMEVKSNDHGTWRRIRAVPFKSLFTNDPQEGDKEKPYQFKLVPDIDEKFDSWKEVFASMLVQRAFKTNGIVKDCEIVMTKSGEYRRTQDYLSQFIADRIERNGDGKINKRDLNNEFSIWYQSNYGGKGPQPKELHEYMDKEFGRQRNQVWLGVSFRSYKNDLTNEDADGDNTTDGDDDISASTL